MTGTVVYPEPQDSARGHRVDEDYVKTLASDFTIATGDVSDAFLGESMIQALRICQWVETTDAKSPIKRGRILTAWAKKYRVGIYRRPRRGASATVTPIRGERVKFSNDQIAANLARMGA